MSILKYISPIFVLTVLLVIQSCSLDEELVDTPTPTLIRNENDVTAVIKGTYARFNDASAFKFRGMVLFMLAADDLYSESGSEFGPIAERTLTGVNTGAFWNQLYFSISSANNLIKTLDDLELSEAFEKRAYGEACFIRAFSYYYLVRMFGGVPLRLEAVDINSDFYLPKTPVEEVYARIFTDLKMASELLPLYGDMPLSDLGRATKGAAQAILAQAYLTYGNQLSLKGQSADAQYTNALVYADSVINSGQYRLLDNYADLFDITKENDAYNEVIFGIRFQTDNQARAQPAAGSEFALRFGASNTHNVSGNTPNGQGAGTFRVMPWFAEYYRKGDYADGGVIDYRNEGAFFQIGYNQVQNKYYAVYPNKRADNGQGTIPYCLVSKYIDPSGKDSRNNGNDLFIIRLAEVYLIKAEAENELHGPTNVALNAFNKVRTRARQADGVSRAIPMDVTAALTKAELRMKIFDERGLELVGEGQRWFDLVRMQHPADPSKTMYEYQFLEVLPTLPKELPSYQNANDRWAPARRGGVYQPALNVSVPKFLLFPIPTDELIKNPEMDGQQNEGW